MTKLTLKQKDNIVSKLYKKYNHAQLDIIYLTQHYNYYPACDPFKVKDNTASYNTSDNKMLNMLDRKRQLEQFVQVIDQIQSHLSKEAQFFIENEYLNFYDRSWWYKYYSRASYYRMKHKALDEFLESSQILLESIEMKDVLN